MLLEFFDMPADRFVTIVKVFPAAVWTSDFFQRISFTQIALTSSMNSSGGWY